MRFSISFIKFFIVILFLGLNLGCKTKTEVKNTQVKFAYIAKQREQSFHEGIVNGIKKEMAKKHLVVDVFAAKHQKDIQSQKDFLNQIVQEKKYQGVMICPNDSQALTDDIAKLDEAGIPYLFIDTPLVESEKTKAFHKNCGYVGTDNFLVGEKAVEFISETITSGNVLMVRGNHQHRSSIDREEGFLRKLKKYPSLNIIGYLQGHWRTDVAYEDFKKFMQTNTQKIHAVFAYNDHMALGISQYYEENHLERPIIIGVDGTVVGQKGLLEKKIDAIIVQATELMGIEGLKRIQECSKEHIVQDKRILTPVTMLTAATNLKRTGL